LQVVHAAAGEEDDTCRRVAFILLKVEIQPETDDADKFEKVDVEIVRLWAIGLPEM
jgi:hypothetical protein